MPRKKKCSANLRSIHGKEKPVQRNAANARERARMRVLSRAFCRLKTTLPWVPADTKLSKLDTLRLASSYIAHLKGILRDEPFTSDETTSLHPAMNLTWPFGFNRGGGNGSGGGGSGSEDADETGSSIGWEEGGSAKDCVHLDDPDEDPNLPFHLNSGIPSHHHGAEMLPHYATSQPDHHPPPLHFHQQQHGHHHHPQIHSSPGHNPIISSACFHDDIMTMG